MERNNISEFPHVPLGAPYKTDGRCLYMGQALGVNGVNGSINRTLLAPSRKGLGAYNSAAVRTLYVRPSIRMSVLPWTATSQRCACQIVQNFTPRSGMV